MNEQIVESTYTGMLFSHEKVWITETRYNMGEPQKHYSKWKKPDKKDHIMSVSIYMEYPEQVNL